jgi:calcineurin-like phosphoesterase family protein
VSDTHFFHKNILTFEDKDGKKIRPFVSLEEMHETLVANWNSVVSDYDVVYHLGDVMFNSSGFNVLRRLNGIKYLVLGNHDHFKATRYLEFFKDILGPHKVSKGMIISHYPIETDSVDKEHFNIHGHVHSNTLSDLRYINVSVENINYTPISYDEIESIMNKRRNKLGYK